MESLPHDSLREHPPTPIQKPTHRRDISDLSGASSSSHRSKASSKADGKDHFETMTRDLYHPLNTLDRSRGPIPSPRSNLPIARPTSFAAIGRPDSRRYIIDDLEKDRMIEKSKMQERDDREKSPMKNVKYSSGKASPTKESANSSDDFEDDIFKISNLSKKNLSHDLFGLGSSRRISPRSSQFTISDDEVEDLGSSSQKPLKLVDCFNSLSLGRLHFPNIRIQTDESASFRWTDYKFSLERDSTDMNFFIQFASEDISACRYWLGAFADDDDESIYCAYVEFAFSNVPFDVELVLQGRLASNDEILRLEFRQPKEGKINRNIVDSLQRALDRLQRRTLRLEDVWRPYAPKIDLNEHSRLVREHSQQNFSLTGQYSSPTLSSLLDRSSSILNHIFKRKSPRLSNMSSHAVVKRTRNSPIARVVHPPVIVNPIRFSGPPRVLLVYSPPTGGGGSIPISTDDFSRLSPGTFLNDSLIDFDLCRSYHEYLSLEFREHVQLYSSFFWKRLGRLFISQQEDGGGVGAGEECSRRQERPSKIDPFSKEMLMIPINEKYRECHCSFVHI